MMMMIFLLVFAQWQFKVSKGLRHIRFGRPSQLSRRGMGYGFLVLFSQQ
jgi:hypothetical protein